MGNSSENAGERNVSEVAAPTFNEHKRARDLIKEIAGHCWSGKGDMIDRVHLAVRRVYPNPKWTRRRLRSFWHGEAAGVRWREMRELEVVAEIESRRRQHIEQAKAEHDQFIARIGATLDRLAVSDQEFHREHMEALCALAGGTTDQTQRNAPGEGAESASSRRRNLTEING